MKIFIVNTLLLLLTFNVYGQKINNSALVPKEIRHKIHTLYPNVKNFEWEKQKDGYSVRFISKNGNENITISSNGIISSGIKINELPEMVKNVIKEKKIGETSTLNIEKEKSKEFGDIFKIKTNNKIYFINNEGKTILTICNK